MSRAVACGCKSLVQLLGCLQMFLAVAWVGCKCSLPWLQVLSDQLVALTRVYRLISLLCMHNVPPTLLMRMWGNMRHGEGVFLANAPSLCFTIQVGDGYVQC